ncbi:MAG TPA: hypothetical protein VJH03_04945, partial [Blastocatellia bacterium]|nr:hypothetical protein [Blastocatellia bacterium]
VVVRILKRHFVSSRKAIQEILNRSDIWRTGICMSLWGAVLLLACLLAACGVPGEPLPPLLEIPAPVQDLTAAQVGAQIQLEWSRPRLTTEGTRAQRLDRIEVYASFYPESMPVPNVPESSDLLAAIPAQSIPETEDRMRLTVRLDASRPGTMAVIAVKAFNDRGRDAGFSNVLTLPVANLPQPPATIEAEVTERAVRLTWTPATQSVFGTEGVTVDGYQVFRRDAGVAEPGAPGTPGTMIGETQSSQYEDTSFEFEHTYLYSVRAFVRRRESVAVTPFSRTAEVVATDRFPPRAPEGVRAVATANSVEIAWSPNEEEDLAGYYVYRGDGGEFARMNPEPLRIPVFRDATVRPGARYRYHVRAADRKGNESEPSGEVAMTAE